MIYPLTQELDWLPLLASLPPWQPPSGPLVLVVPHPDDETLGAGGFLAMRDPSKEGRVQVVAVTDGENAYGPDPHLAGVRIKEQECALALLGVPKEQIIRLHLTDSSVAADKQKLVAALLPLVTPQTHIIAPWRGDFHPDHEACGEAAESVARQRGAKLTSYFFWSWHRGTPATLAELSLVSYQLSAEAMKKKQAALHRHRSQLSHPSGEPILPEYLLAPAYRTVEVFAVEDAPE